MRENTVVLSKDFIIEAIREEPVDNLWAGRWMHIMTGATECRACAVGTVMRKAVQRGTSAHVVGQICGLNTKDDIVQVGSCDEDYLTTVALGQLLAGRAMNALSTFFEGVARANSRGFGQSVSEIVKEKTIEFVRTHFPAEVEVNLGVVQPERKKGIKRKIKKAE